MKITDECPDCGAFAFSCRCGAISDQEKVEMLKRAAQERADEEIRCPELVEQLRLKSIELVSLAFVRRDFCMALGIPQDSEWHVILQSVQQLKEIERDD